MEFINRFQKKNPLHIYSYEVENNILKLIIINISLSSVGKVTIKYNDKFYDIDLNNRNDKVFEVSCEISKKIRIEQPRISKAEINNEEFPFSYTTDYIYLIEPKSISSMMNEKYLYIQKMVKYNNCKKENVRCVADQFTDYWHCTCGSVNFNMQDECINCKIKKEDLFSHSIDNSVEEAKSRKILKSNGLVIWWLILVLVVQFFVIDTFLGGDILFKNEILNTAPSIINRIIISVFPLVTTIGVILSRKKYNKVAEISFELSRLFILIYINIMISTFPLFLMNSYLLVSCILLDIIFVALYIYLLIYGILSKVNWVRVGLISILMLLSLGQAIMYSQYDITIQNKGLALTCTSNQEVYVVPEEIGYRKVTSITFSPNIDYSNIKEIHFSKNIENVYIYSTLDLPNIEFIYVPYENETFTVKGGMLFNKKSNKIAYVPLTTKEVVIDWEVVDARSFDSCINLEKVVVGNEVKDIKTLAFANCTSLKEFNVDNASNLKTIGEQAFLNCSSLEYFELPNSIEEIDCPILSGCNSLKEIKIPFLGEKRYQVQDYSNKNAFAYLLGPSHDYKNAANTINQLKKVVITDQMFLENASFYNCIADIIELNVSRGNIEINSFYKCKNLKEFVISEGIEQIKENAFNGCSSLTKINLPSTITYIGKNAFKDCESLVEIELSPEINIENLLENIEKEGNQIIIDILNNL